MKFWYKSYIEKYTNKVYGKIFIWNHIKKFKPKFLNKLLGEFARKSSTLEWASYLPYFFQLIRVSHVHLPYSVQLIRANHINLPYLSQLIRASHVNLPYLAQLIRASHVILPYSAQLIRASHVILPYSAQLIRAIMSSCHTRPNWLGWPGF